MKSMKNVGGFGFVCESDGSKVTVLSIAVGSQTFHLQETIWPDGSDPSYRLLSNNERLSVRKEGNRFAEEWLGYVNQRQIYPAMEDLVWGLIAAKAKTALAGQRKWGSVGKK